MELHLKDLLLEGEVSNKADSSIGKDACSRSAVKKQEFESPIGSNHSSILL